METLMNKGDQRSHELLVAFRDGYLSQPPEQLGGVQGTPSTYLEYFLSPEISEVFCANEPTLPMHQIAFNFLLTHLQFHVGMEHFP